MISKFFHSKLIISLALFLLALIPRLPDLGRFLTADEFLWVDRSRNFLAALINPAFQCDSVVEEWGYAAHGLACTLRTGHPGVTTMWTGSFGFILRWLWDGRPIPLYDYVVAIATNPLDASFIAPERLGTVLLTSFWVVAVYWLARRLFGPAIALVWAILLALDPFHIALSRVIHHDALSTAFMTLSVLGMFIYWGEKSVNSYQLSVNSDLQNLSGGRRSAVSGHWLRRRGWLFFSGVCAGFAFLSKSPALYLMPFVALTGLWFTAPAVWNKKARVDRKILLPTAYSLLLDGLLWFAVAAAIFIIFWPAMWVAPLEAVQTVLFIGGKYATGGHAKGNFFLGETSQDPGALFYPVTWLYRTSPLVVAGVLVALVAWPFKGRGAGERGSRGDSSFIPHPSSFFRYLPLILLFILGFYLLMTIGEKKQDRYFLPVYPWLNLIAAAGLVAIYDLRFTIYDRFVFSKTPYSSRITFYALRFMLLAFIIFFQSTLVYLNFPYYFTYFNPLLGGIQGAANGLTIGWGEGLDLAAAYLNETVDPAHTRVASWYQSTFAPFYRGQSISYSKEKGKALAGDYVIFYINQTQRRFPDDALFEYYESRFKPVKIITLHGLDYAWIYPSLGVDHYLDDQTYTGIASLLAWQWLKGDAPLAPGQPAEFELYWEYLGKRPEETFFFRLVDSQGRRVAEGSNRPVAAENSPPEKWNEGEIIVERGALTVPPGTPPGQYQLQIGFYTQAPAVTEGQLRFTLPEAESSVTVGPTPPAAFTLPVEAAVLNQPLGDSLTLLGATRPIQSPRPSDGQSNLHARQTGSPISLNLYWCVEKPLPATTGLHLGLMKADGSAQQAWFDLSLAETLHPDQTTWQPGDIIHTTWSLDLLPDTPPGPYTLQIIWPPSTQTGQLETVSLGTVVLAPEKTGQE